MHPVAATMSAVLWDVMRVQILVVTIATARTVIVLVFQRAVTVVLVSARFLALHALKRCAAYCVLVVLRSADLDFRFSTR